MKVIKQFKSGQLVRDAKRSVRANPSAPKYIVWIREGGRWEEQGDGPMTLKEATRIANEIRHDFRLQTKILPEDDMTLSVFTGGRENPPAQYQAGDRVIYDDGRPGHQGVGGTVLYITPAGDSMKVQWDDRADTSFIRLNDLGWMEHIRRAPHPNPASSDQRFRDFKSALYYKLGLRARQLDEERILITNIEPKQSFRSLQEAIDHYHYVLQNDFETNPVSVHRLPHSSRFRVRTPHGIKAFGTTRARAASQARLLRGVEHGFVPTGHTRRNPAQRFSVVERFNGYELVDNRTEEKAWLGDGVDALTDRNGEPISPGTEHFRKAWERELNANAGETAEVYFP